MFVEGLAEMRRGVNQGWERARAGVDQFLHAERGSRRFSWKRDAALYASAIAGIVLPSGVTLLAKHALSPESSGFINTILGKTGVEITNATLLEMLLIPIVSTAGLFAFVLTTDSFIKRHHLFTS